MSVWKKKAVSWGINRFMINFRPYLSIKLSLIFAGQNGLYCREGCRGLKIWVVVHVWSML